MTDHSYLAADIYLTRVNDRAIILDLARDRYLGLGKTLADAALYLSGRDGANIGGEALASARSKLLAQGILSSSPQPESTFAAAPVPRSAMWPGVSCTWKAGSAAALLALSETGIALRTIPIRRIVERLRRTKLRCLEEATPVEPTLVVDSFFSARPWFPILPICRLDAIALALVLWRSRQNALLIFGVKLDPFAAHCWVQLGDVVVNEAEDSVRRYTPIMTI